MRFPSSLSSLNNQYYENVIHAIQESFKKYNVNLEMCLNDIFIMNGFLDFLKSEHNASSLEFVVKIDEYANSHHHAIVPPSFQHNNNNGGGGRGRVNSPSGGSFPLTMIQTNNNHHNTTNTTTTSNISNIGSGGSTSNNNLLLLTSIGSTSTGSSSSLISVPSPSKSGSGSGLGKFHRKDSSREFMTSESSLIIFGNDGKSRKTKAKEIIDKFLNDHSAYQVNLSSQIRETVMRNYEKECSRGGGENDINPHLFDEARLEVSLQLKCDSFVRFVKSQNFFNLIISKIEKEVSSKNLDSIYKFLNSYFSKIGEVKRSQVSQFMTCNSNRIHSPSSPIGSGSSSSPIGVISPREDFLSDEISVDSIDSVNHVNHTQTMLSLHTLSPTTLSESKIVSLESVLDIRDRFSKSISELADENVSDRQFDLLLELINNDSLWEKVHEDSESLCYVSENKFYHNNRGLKIYKEVGIIEDSSPEEVLYALTDMRILNIIDDTMSDVKFEKYVKGQPYSVSYLSNKMKMAWPISDRQFIVGTSIRDEPNLSGYTILRRSLDSKEVPQIKGSVRGIFLGGVVIEKLSDKHTRFTASGFVDMGGKFPLSLFNKILSLRQSKGVENVKKGIAKRRSMTPEEQVLNSENSMYLLDTLFYYRYQKSLKPANIIFK